jgi:hypothetical protein
VYDFPAYFFQSVTNGPLSIIKNQHAAAAIFIVAQ